MRHFKVSIGKRRDFVIVDAQAADTAVVDMEVSPMWCQSSVIAYMLCGIYVRGQHARDIKD